MKNEVEEFLRRVAQMRAQAEAQAKGQQQQRAQKPQKPPQQPKQQPRLAPSPPPRTIAAPLQQQVEVVEAELADRADRVSRQVEEDLRGTQQISEHTRQLGAEVDASDERLEAHLHQVFDHKLGQLKASEAAPAPDRATSELSLTQILRMLRSPTSIRDAIIMSEVLKRPEF